MPLYTDTPELNELHQHWLAAQERMLEAHELARGFDARLTAGDFITPEELVAGADLAARARDATEIWLHVDARFAQANLAYLEKGRLVLTSRQ